MKTSLKILIPGIAALALAACGAPLADGTYEGEPLVRLQGNITGTASSPARDPYIGIVWVNWARNGDLMVSDVAPVQASSFPATFDFAVFDPPPAEAIMDFSGQDEDARLAAGYLFAFDDVDGDGVFHIGKDGLEGGDQIIGISWSHMLVYVETPPRTGGRFEQEGILFTDVADATSGFHLGRGVCASSGEVFDRLELVAPSTPVDVTLVQPSATPPEMPDAACLNVF